MSSVSQRTKNIFMDMTAGSISSLLVVAYGISFGALIFSFDQGAFLSQGMSVTLISCVVVGLIASLFSSLPIIVAGPDSLATALLAVTASAIANDVHLAGGQPANVLATVLFALTFSSVVAGVIYFVLGYFRHGMLMQYLPYPVVGGFLAGSGYMILMGSLRMLSDSQITLVNVMLIPENWPLSTFIAGLISAVLLFIPILWKHYLFIPLTIIFGIGFTYFCIFFLDMDLETARADHVIFQPLDVKAPLPLPLIALSDVYWQVIVAHTAEIFVTIGVALITVLMNTTGIEVMIKRDLDHDRELMVAGISNIFSGIVGGIFGYQFFNRTNINYLAGANSRLSGIWSSMLCLGILLVFPGLVGYFPKPVLAGLLAYVGIALMHAWVIKTYRQLNAYEYGLILLILAVIVAKGFMIGVLVGITGSCVLFAFHYGQISAIKYDFTGCQNFSKCVRSPEKMELLKNEASSVYGVCVREYIFFGSAHEILVRCRSQVEKGTKFILIDFRLAQGLEASGGRILLRLSDFCHERGVRLLFTAMNHPLRNQLQRLEFPFNRVVEFDDLADGMKYVEDRLLGSENDETDKSENPIERQLSHYFSSSSLNHLLEYLSKEEVKLGSVIFRRGEAGDHLYFIAKGQVNIVTALDNDTKSRLGAYSDGTVIGEMSVLSGSPRSAYVVANSDCVLYKLTRSDIERMGRECSPTLVELQQYLLITLSNRFSSMSQAIEIMM